MKITTLIKEIILLIVLTFIGVELLIISNGMPGSNPDSGLDFSGWNKEFVYIFGVIACIIAVIILFIVIKNIIKLLKNKKAH